MCAECAEEHGVFAAHVEGRLELERLHGSTTCVRGHSVRIERANHEPIGVLTALSA